VKKILWIDKRSVAERGADVFTNKMDKQKNVDTKTNFKGTIALNNFSTIKKNIKNLIYNLDFLYF
jgi:hypothetical protein